LIRGVPRAHAPPVAQQGGSPPPLRRPTAKAMQRSVAVLGDDVALGQGCPISKSFVDEIQRVLEPHGVDVLNWSREEQTVAVCATEQLNDLQAQLQDTVATSSQTAVVIELGIHDRVFLGEMLGDTLQMLVRVVQDMNAIPIVMQVVPDDVDQRVAQDLGAAFVPAPASLVEQFAKDPKHPFIPHPDAHKDLAKNLLAVLGKELQLPLAADDKKDTLLAGGQRRDSKTAADGHGSGFDGVWMHKDQPSLLEIIKDGIIKSDDGSSAKVQPISHDSFFIEQQGHRVSAEVRGNELIWSDGDIWCRVENFGVPTMGRPPQRKSKGDMNSFMAAWEQAEEACLQTTKELRKNEIGSERERLEHERARLEDARQQLEDGMQTLHEETEKVSTLREEVREVEIRQSRGIFGCCSAG